MEMDLTADAAAKVGRATAARRPQIEPALLASVLSPLPTAQTSPHRLKTPVQAPRANAIMERWVGSVRREILDRILMINAAHLRTVLAEYQNPSGIDSAA